MSATTQAPPQTGRLAELRDSARGWHGVQLAVLGFIGLCGAINDGTPQNPTWLQTLATVLVLAALGAACLATFLVGRAAWPLYGPKRRVMPEDDDDEIRATSRRLTTGLALTFVAVVLLALGSLTSWWPREESPAQGTPVQLQLPSSSP
jgi:hypothetical protein